MASPSTVNPARCAASSHASGWSPGRPAPGRRAGDGPPRRRGHAGRAPLGDHDAGGAERRRRPDRRPQVARVGHAVERDDQRRRPASNARPSRSSASAYSIRRDLEHDPLVHRPVAEPVEVAARRLQQRDAPADRELHRLAYPVVGVQVPLHVQRGRRDPRLQRLDDRVAADDQLRGLALAPGATARRRAAFPRPAALRPADRVRRAPCGLAPAGRPAALQPLPALTARADDRTLLASPVRRVRRGAVSCRPSGRSQRPARAGRGCPRRGSRPPRAGPGSRRRRQVLAGPGRLPRSSSRPAASASTTAVRSTPAPVRARARPAGRRRARRASPGPRRTARPLAPCPRPASAALPSRTARARPPAPGAPRSSSIAAVNAAGRSSAGALAGRRSAARVTNPSTRRYAAAASSSGLLGVLHRGPVVRRGQVVAQLDRAPPA